MDTNNPSTCTAGAAPRRSSSRAATAAGCTSGPHVAERSSPPAGFFVVGFDVKAYLESFTSGNGTLRPEDEPGDYKVLADFAARGATQKPILIGVSEGAGLSVLAATDPRTKAPIAGVIGLGLPDVNELGWRWRDALIYLTHGVPNEPTFSTAAIVDRVEPGAARAPSTPRATSSCRSPRSSACSTRRRSPSGCGSSRRRTTGSATTWPSSIGALLEAIAWVAEQRGRGEVDRVANGCARRCRSSSAWCCSSPRSRCCASSCARSSWHELTADVLATPPARLALAVALTALNYAALTGYDLLAFAYIGKPLPRRADRRRVVPRLRHLEQRRLRDALRRVGALSLLHALGRDRRGAVADRRFVLGHVLARAARARRAEPGV